MQGGAPRSAHPGCVYCRPLAATLPDPVRTRSPPSAAPSCRSPALRQTSGATCRKVRDTERKRDARQLRDAVLQRQVRRRVAADTLLAGSAGVDAAVRHEDARACTASRSSMRPAARSEESARMILVGNTSDAEAPTSRQDIVRHARRPGQRVREAMRASYACGPPARSRAMGDGRERQVFGELSTGRVGRANRLRDRRRAPAMAARRGFTSCSRPYVTCRSAGRSSGQAAPRPASEVTRRLPT